MDYSCKRFASGNIKVISDKYTNTKIFRLDEKTSIVKQGNSYAGLSSITVPLNMPSPAIFNTNGSVNMLGVSRASATGFLEEPTCQAM